MGNWSWSIRYTYQLGDKVALTLTSSCGDICVARLVGSASSGISADLTVSRLEGEAKRGGI